jgi:hypothetical protein
MAPYVMDWDLLIQHIMDAQGSIVAFDNSDGGGE